MPNELAQLQAEAEALGIKVDGRWGAERLRTEIEVAAEVKRRELEAWQAAAGGEHHPPPDEKASETGPDSTLGQDPGDPDVPVAGAPDAQEGAQDEPELTEDEAIAALEDERDDDLPTPIRAGGHIDYGDGRGWVIEE